MKTKLPAKIGYKKTPKIQRAFDSYGKTTTKEFQDKNRDKLIIHPDKIKLSGDGVFFTIQGEGPTTGQPAVFCRLHVCNLQCTWCDAWYTWQRETPEFWTESNDYAIPVLAQMLEDAWQCDNKTKKRVVFTGGEPTLQRNQLTLLLPFLIKDKEGWAVEMETNGTLMPTEEMLRVIQFNCSPKLENSKNPRELRIKPKVLQALNGVNTMFKFVVMTEADVEEVERDFVKDIGLDPNKVALMPQGVTTEELNINMARVAEICKRKGYRMFSRLHVNIWGGALRKV